MTPFDRTSAAAFADVAELYERRRPSYPPDLVAWVARRLDLRPGRTVADIGAGTGKLTRLLVPTGARVIAVEPLPEMRAQLAATVPNAEVVAGRAEELPLDDGSVDALTVAAAIHWFEPEAYRELHRVLRPRRSLAVVSNHRDVSDPLQAAVQEIVGPHLPTLEDFPRWREDLPATGLFAVTEEFHTTYEQLVDADGLAERMNTVSYVARMPEDERSEVLARVRALGAAQPEELFVFRYRSYAYVFHRRNGD